MNVKITETGKLETLSITGGNGIDWTDDLVGNAGAVAFGNASAPVEGLFAWSENENAYLASQETFDWWDQYIADYDATEDDAQKLADKLGVDLWIIRERIEKAQDDDYENHRACAIDAMQEIEEEYA